MLRVIFTSPGRARSIMLGFSASIALEKDRYDSLLPLVAGIDLKVVALCMSDEGMPNLGLYSQPDGPS